MDKKIVKTKTKKKFWIIILSIILIIGVVIVISIPVIGMACLAFLIWWIPNQTGDGGSRPMSQSIDQNFCFSNK